MKRLITGLLILGAGYASAAEFSGNVTYATDYRFRGISQGDRSQAIQGGFDIEFDNGAYFGTWASNTTLGGANIEVDYYGGYAFDLNEDSSVDVGLLWYNYPEDDADPDLDFWEVYGSYSWKDLTVGLAISPDYYAETDTYYYIYGDYSFGLAENLSLDLHLGVNVFDDDSAGPSFGIGELGDPEDQYFDYGIGLTTSRFGLDWTAAVIGTDLDEDQCFPSTPPDPAKTKLCDDTIVLSVSKSL